MEKDPMEDLIADGRVDRQPYTFAAEAMVLNINMEELYTRIFNICYNTWIYNSRLMMMGYTVEEIAKDIETMTTFLLLNCYNRLRLVAERHSHATRLARFGQRAPCSDKMEFPAFLSSLVQSIGPIHVNDASDVMIVYAPKEWKMDNYGRDDFPKLFQPGGYFRLIECLKGIGVPMAPVDMHTDLGSFWTTCEIEMKDGLINVVGTLDRSHYIIEDVPRALLLNFGLFKNPFQHVYEKGDGPRVHTCYIAKNITEYEMHNILRYRLLPPV